MVQGTSDIPLNDEGRAQAEAAGKAFDGVEFDALITSPLKRAKETGQLLIKNAHAKEVKTDERLIEKHFGICEGMVSEKRHRLYPHGGAPGEESYDHVGARMKAALDDITSTYTGNVLVVGHAAAITQLLRVLDKSREYSTPDMKNTALNIIDGDERLVAYNLTGDEACEFVRRLQEEK